MTIRRNIIGLSMAVLAVIAAILPAPRAHAYTQADLNNINSKISELRQQIAGYEEQASALAAEANTIQGRINALRVEQNNLRTQIQLKEAEREQLAVEIEALTNRINDNSQVVGYTIAEYYYNDEVSELERIISADSFASYIDQEMQLSTVSDTLSDIIEENKNLKAQLEIKKQNAERLIQDLNSQKAIIEQNEREEASLLATARENEAGYRQLKSEADSQKASLEEEQQKILADLARQYNARGLNAGDPKKGGYPYSNRCPQQKDAFADQWGMYICECVSYTAWKVYSTYGYMPYWGGRGNAKQWPANARAAGYTVSSTPKVGSVGISTGGAYGHAVWVEAVSGNSVYISQYNERNAATGYRAGEYSEKWIDAGMYQYIYFSGKK